MRHPQMLCLSRSRQRCITIRKWAFDLPKRALQLMSMKISESALKVAPFILAGPRHFVNHSLDDLSGWLAF